MGPSSTSSSHRTEHTTFNFNRQYFIFLLVLLLATSGCGVLKPSRPIKTKIYNSKKYQHFHSLQKNIQPCDRRTLYWHIADISTLFTAVQFFFICMDILWVICCPRWLQIFVKAHGHRYYIPTDIWHAYYGFNLIFSLMSSLKM